MKTLEETLDDYAKLVNNPNKNLWQAKAIKKIYGEIEDPKKRLEMLGYYFSRVTQYQR